MEYHQYANLFPMMTADELAQLCDDMRTSGYDHTAPIMLYNGLILDGRNRQLAADTVGVLPSYTNFAGDDQAALAFVIRHNLKRRHLNETQRALVAGRLANMNEGRPKNNSANLQSIQVSQSAAATMLNVSPRTVATVKAVAKAAPELVEQMESGKLTAGKAMKKVKKAQRAIPLFEEPEAITEPVYAVHRGDIWQLGRHRLMCGDAYDCDDKNALIDNNDVTALVTDPPYGIGYKPDWNKWDGRPSDFSQVIGDDQEFDPSSFLSYPTVVMFGANYFSNRLPVGGWACWDKRLDEIKDAMMGSPFELAWYRSEKTTRKAIMIRLLHGGVVNADSVVGNNEKRLHPTQKPIVVMEQIIEATTNADDIILDPFSGSGSTLLACEKKNRRCLAMEIDADYVAVILQRWYEKTGVSPVLLGGNDDGRN